MHSFEAKNDSNSELEIHRSSSSENKIVPLKSCHYENRKENITQIRRKRKKKRSGIQSRNRETIKKIIDDICIYIILLYIVV